MSLWDRSLGARDVMTLQEQLEPVLVCCWTDSLELGHGHGLYHWFSGRGDFASPGGIWQCLDVVLIVRTGGSFWLPTEKDDLA